MNHLVFVTGNLNKQEEIREIMKEEFSKDRFYENALQLHFYNPKEEIHEIQSINTSEVAHQKAIDVAKVIEADQEFMKTFNSAKNIYVMVDDTGLYAKTSPINRKTYANLGYPGALIKNYMSSIESDPCKAICHEFGGSVAFAECSIGFHNIILNTTDCVTYTTDGYIPVTPKYNETHDDFGWDPCFVPRRDNFDLYDDSDPFNEFYKNESYSQMKNKNTYSMRNKAIGRALDKIAFDINVTQHLNIKAKV